MYKQDRLVEDYKIKNVFKYNGAVKRDGEPYYSYNNPQSVQPQPCSMWFMGGNTNVKYSHRVKSEPDPDKESFRVSVTFRQSPKLQRQNNIKV